ncbi:MAG: NAD-dependent deacylase [Saprospiraceae bacterium]|nr:NAD-dependent deacylase [Saprospiraceae bacterium]
MPKIKIVVLTGAGMSVESGLKTFRDSDGLWENHDIMQVASLSGWNQNPNLVQKFYNERRAQLQNVNPNEGHFILAQLETKFQINVITQNVDDLHERAGSLHVTHLHGELLKVRCTNSLNHIFDWKSALHMGHKCFCGAQLRPNIVWFGEDVPLFEVATQITENADILLVVGTSLQVYPAASLLHYTASSTPIYYIDPKPEHIKSKANIHIIKANAVEGLKTFQQILNQLS